MEIRPDDPMRREVGHVIARHLALMRQVTPPESIHALPAEGLAGRETAFFTLRGEDGTILGMGAIKTIEPGHGEIKSMHVVEEARGRGLSRLLLDHLLQVARDRGLRRVSLETGAQAAFRPAVALYESAGFARCGPFTGYVEDANSIFMTLRLD
ncbi:MAG: GNAT family N-acetyltransferase [Gemmobacter sp.]